MEIAPFERRLRSGQGVVLRSAAAADATAVLAYVQALGREAARNLNHPAHVYESFTPESEVAFLERLAKHPRAFYLAAFDGERVAGAASLEMAASTYSAHSAELGLGVLDAYRGQGLGRILMEALIAHATTNGVWNLTLRVRAFNAPAIALYESLGFRRVGTLQRIIELPDGLFDEHVYQLERR